MEQDFFDEEIEEKEEKKQVERIPAPSVQGQKPSKKPKAIRWWHILLGVGIAVYAFIFGYAAAYSAIDPELHTLMRIKKAVQKDYYKEVSDEEFYGTLFSAINNDLLDDYSQYLTAEELLQLVGDLNGNRIGIGLVFGAQDTQPLRIMRVSGNSPAEKAGLRAGEVIIGCGGTETEIAPCATYEEFAAMITLYNEDEPFYLAVRSIAGEERIVQVTRSAYVENYIFYRTKYAAYSFDLENNSEMVEHGAPMTFLPEDTAYIQIVQFTGNAQKDFDKAMKKFKEDDMTNLVLDLRGNGGGYLDAMQSISSYFCKDAILPAPVVAVADYGEYREPFVAYGNHYYQYFSEESRICVLADSGTASASECLLGCMLDYGAIGYDDICLSERGGVAKTFGKGIMQETKMTSFFAADAIKLTTAEIRWPVSDDSIHGRGILPEDGTLTVEENFDLDAEAQAAIEKLFE